MDWLREQWRLFLTGYFTGSGYDRWEVWPLTWWQRAVTHLLYPPERHRPDETVIAYCIDRYGVTEADIRDCQYEWNRDVVVVRLWNWRRFEVRGDEFHRWRR